MLDPRSDGPESSRVALSSPRPTGTPIFYERLAPYSIALRHRTRCLVVKSSSRADDSTSTHLWQAESLRLTVFPVPESDHSVQSWWTELLDGPPEQIVTKPRSGETRLQGTTDNLLLQLRAEPMRITLGCSAKPSSSPPIGEHTLGPYNEAWGEFSTLVAAGVSLGTFPGIERLAFGAVLCRPAKTLQSGYRILERYLPNVTIDDGSSDFLYQINRRRPSRVIDGLQVNRLSKWSIALVQDMMLRGDGAVLKMATALSCRSELDINTDPSNKGELPRDRLQDLFAECVAFADEIATNGDVP